MMMAAVPADDALIKPMASSKAPHLGPTAIMAASEDDLDAIAHDIGAADWRRRSLYMSKVLYDPHDRSIPALVGPIIGAPYAAMILELIIAWGVERVVFVGWCGSIDSDLRVGQIVVPTGAWPDDGTSKHYRISRPGPVRAEVAAVGSMAAVLDQHQLAHRKGLIWTTDGVFRETPAKIALFKKRGALAVEMEVAALLAVAAFRKVTLGAALVVSDELFRMKWKHGFRDRRFKQSRRLVGRAAVDVCREVADGTD